MTWQGADEAARLCAPRRHGESVIVPPYERWPLDLAENRRVSANRRTILYKCTLSDVAAQARRQLCRAACHYSRQYRDDILSGDEDRPIVLVGHQPELFHPGVWFKVFALSSFARRTGAIPIHLLADHDLCRSASVALPNGSGRPPAVERVPFDGATIPLPYECRSIVDRDLFASFSDRVASRLRERGMDPLVARMWPRAVEGARQGLPLGQVLARARHALEADWGWQTWELPFSHFCGGEPFLRFVLAILVDIHRFVEIHNQALSEYRRAFRIRSRTHPVTPLQVAEGLYETPFWIWSNENPIRRPLFIQQSERVARITDRDRICVELPPLHTAPEVVLEKLIDLSQRAIAIRPRALMTTMYARLVLGDYFIHGIGGARYDTLTDMLMVRFFEERPPHFAALTATILLPGAGDDRVTLAELRQVTQELRELRFHPERFIDAGDREARAMAAAKEDWIEQSLPRGTRRERHEQIAAINMALQPYVDRRRRQRLEDQLALYDRLQEERVSSRRDYSFCIYPEEYLREALV